MEVWSRHQGNDREIWQHRWSDRRNGSKKDAPVQCRQTGSMYSVQQLFTYCYTAAADATTIAISTNSTTFIYWLTSYFSDLCQVISGSQKVKFLTFGVGLVQASEYRYGRCLFATQIAASKHWRISYTFVHITLYCTLCMWTAHNICTWFPA